MSTYERNIQIIDTIDGESMGVTSLDSIGGDLAFLFGVTAWSNPDIFGAIVDLERAYVNGEPCGDLETFLGIELRTI